MEHDRHQFVLRGKNIVNMKKFRDSEGQIFFVRATAKCQVSSRLFVAAPSSPESELFQCHAKLYVSKPISCIEIGRASRLYFVVFRVHHQ